MRSARSSWCHTGTRRSSSLTPSNQSSSASWSFCRDDNRLSLGKSASFTREKLSGRKLTVKAGSHWFGGRQFTVPHREDAGFYVVSDSQHFEILLHSCGYGSALTVIVFMMPPNGIFDVFNGAS